MQACKHNLIVIAFFLIVTAGVCLSVILPRSDSDLLVLFVSPFSQDTYVYAVLDAADGELVRTGKWPWLALVSSQNPGFVSDLYSAGALFVGDGEFFAACFNPTSFNKL